MIVGEGRRSFFFLGTPMFLSSPAAERVARNVGGGREGGRKEERVMQREERPRRDGSSLRRVGNCSKVCKSETRGSAKGGKGLLSLPKKATTFISALCSRPTVD